MLSGAMTGYYLRNLECCRRNATVHSFHLNHEGGDRSSQNRLHAFLTNCNSPPLQVMPGSYYIKSLHDDGRKPRFGTIGLPTAFGI